MATKTVSAFAIWITGLPASGKSTLAAAVKTQLTARGIDVAVLESDELRKVFTPNPTYDEKERKLFYSQLAYVGALLTHHGVPVIFDATANRRDYREAARQQIPKFLEVYIDSPLALCVSRDPKGIYRSARDGGVSFVPGIQAAYEPPEHPDLVVHAGREDTQAAAGRLLAELTARGFITDERQPL